MSPVIRNATPADVELMADWAIAMAWETEHKKLDGDTVRRGIRAVFALPGRGRYFIAEREGKAAGTLMITYEWSDWHNRLYWWLQSVYVHEDHRGKGVFRDLFEFVREEAKRSNAVHAFCLYVDKENHRAKRTYHGLGFEMSNYDIMECVL